jgi:hypothetical protein
VRCLFEIRPARGDSAERHTYEERITIWRADTIDAAIALAEAEARAYSATISATYLGFAQAYRAADRPEPGAEVFSLSRDSRMQPGAYVDHFFDSGEQRQTHPA